MIQIITLLVLAFALLIYYLITELKSYLNHTFVKQHELIQLEDFYRDRLIKVEANAINYNDFTTFKETIEEKVYQRFNKLQQILEKLQEEANKDLQNEIKQAATPPEDLTKLEDKLTQQINTLESTINKELYDSNRRTRNDFLQLLEDTITTLTHHRTKLHNSKPN